MATGSGKTLIMAGAIIYLYKQGYRNFLFFVNSTNIINKTRENFLNPLSSKYLLQRLFHSAIKKSQSKKWTIFKLPMVIISISLFLPFRGCIPV